MIFNLGCYCYFFMFKMLIYFSVIDFSLKNEVKFFAFNFIHFSLFKKYFFQINYGPICLSVGFCGLNMDPKIKSIYFVDQAYSTRLKCELHGSDQSVYPPLMNCRAFFSHQSFHLFFLLIFNMFLLFLMVNCRAFLVVCYFVQFLK